MTRKLEVLLVGRPCRPCYNKPSSIYGVGKERGVGLKGVNSNHPRIHTHGQPGVRTRGTSREYSYATSFSLISYEALMTARPCYSRWGEGVVLKVPGISDDIQTRRSQKGPVRGFGGEPIDVWEAGRTGHTS